MSETPKSRWPITVASGKELLVLTAIAGALNDALVEALRDQPRDAVLRARQAAMDAIKRGVAEGVSHDTEADIMDAALAFIDAVMPDGGA